MTLQQLVQINHAPSESKRIRLGLGHIQRLVQEIGQPIQFLDGGDDRLGLLAIVSQPTTTSPAFRELP